MADTPPSADQTVILFPHSWQRLLLFLAFGLFVIWFPFMGALAAASVPSAAHVFYPGAARITPVINLTLAIIACAPFLSELPHAKTLDRSLFLLFFAITTALSFVSYDSSVHLLHAFGVNLGLPTADSIPSPWGSFAWAVAVWYVVIRYFILPLFQRRENRDHA